MYKKKLFYAIICLVITLPFISCGEDTVTGQQVPVGTVFYSLDSLSVWVIGPNTVRSGSIVFSQTVNAGKVKVEYTVQTNVDSVHSDSWVSDSSNGSPAHPVTQYYYWSVDSLVSYTMDIPAAVYLKLEIMIRSKSSVLNPYYVRLKNIKVTKQ